MSEYTVGNGWVHIDFTTGKTETYKFTDEEGYDLLEVFDEKAYKEAVAEIDEATMRALNTVVKDLDEVLSKRAAYEIAYNMYKELEDKVKLYRDTLEKLVKHRSFKTPEAVYPGYVSFSDAEPIAPAYPARSEFKSFVAKKDGQEYAVERTGLTHKVIK